jgi:hypothetical protein
MFVERCWFNHESARPNEIAFNESKNVAGGRSFIVW